MPKSFKHVSFKELRDKVNVIKSYDYEFDDARNKLNHMLNNLDAYSAEEINTAYETIRRNSPIIYNMEQDLLKTYGKPLGFIVSYLNEYKDCSDETLIKMPC